MKRLPVPDYATGLWKSGASSRYFRPVLLLSCLTILLSSCARLPISGTETTSLNATFVTRLDDEALFAAAPDGKRVAFSRNGVKVMPLPTGDAASFSTEHPLTMAWSPDGTKLAAAFGREKKSKITVFRADGVTISEAETDGDVAAIFWTDSDSVLVVIMELAHHTFGTSCREVLLRWQLTGPPERRVLHEVTLKPSTVRTRGARQLTHLTSPAISPLGDELIYMRIHDAPAFDAYLNVMVRNNTNGTEREMGRISFDDGAAHFSADGEELLMPDSAGRIRRIDAWSGAEKQLETFSGRSLAVSPDDTHLLADGRLLKSGTEIAQFPPRSTGTFLDDGRLLIINNGALFLVSGFAAAPPVTSITPEKRERLRTIRAWRASGLISADDYVSAKEKVIK